MMADETEDDDPVVLCDTDDIHAVVPCDADGNPDFLIIPPGMQAEYDRTLAACRVGWQATGDPAALMEALVLSCLYRQPPPLWLVEAACMVMSKRRTKRYMTRRYNATIKWMRYVAVRDAVGAGFQWQSKHGQNAYERAAEQLAGTKAAAQSPSMKAHYDEVARDLKQGRSALYVYTPKIPKFEKAQTPRSK